MRKFRPTPGCVVQGYRFALDPNAAQEAALRSHCGAARTAYDWAIGWVTASWRQRGVEQTYGLSGEELTPWRSWSLPELRKAFNEAEKSDPRFADWWQGNSKEAYNTGLANAAAAFDNYARSKQGKRKGKRVGSPRCKAKHKTALSCRFTTGTIRLEPDRRHVILPRLGTIRMHESTRELHRRLAAGTARILSATVRHERGRWLVSFQVEVAWDIQRVARPGSAIADAGFGQIRRRLAYKGRRHACPTVVANRWFASSKTCSGCGAVKARLPLHAWVFDREVCGLDRDENAARNLLALTASTVVTGTGVAGDPGAQAPKPRGADHKTRTTRPGRDGQAARTHRSSGGRKRGPSTDTGPPRLRCHRYGPLQPKSRGC